MDTFANTVFGSPGALGILYAEDFALETAPVPEPEPEPVPQEAALTQADLAAACSAAAAAAVQAAEAAWVQDARERRTVALQTMAAGLAEARQAGTLHAEAVAEALVQTVLGMVAGMLPEFCRLHGDREVRALAGRFLPLLARSTPVVVRVHAALMPALREDLAGVDEGLLDQVEFRPANLPPGDTRLAWDQGSLVRDQAAIRAALAEGLAELGLLPGPAADIGARDAQPSRSLTYAE